MGLLISAAEPLAGTLHAEPHPVQQLRDVLPAIPNPELLLDELRHQTRGPDPRGKAAALRALLDQLAEELQLLGIESWPIARRRTRCQCIEPARQIGAEPLADRRVVHAKLLGDLHDRTPIQAK